MRMDDLIDQNHYQEAQLEELRAQLAALVREKSALEMRVKALEEAGVPARNLHYSDLVHDFYIMGDVSPAVVLAAKEAGEAIKAAL